MKSSESLSDRFAFGENWSKFLKGVDDATVAEARRSLAAMIGLDDLSGRSFLDIGCGSGLFSLAACRMGATVTSFDYDADSVRCAELLRERFGESNSAWKVMQGSVLDEGFMDGLGGYDIVYSWGVLHHTGEMWKAIEMAAKSVDRNGLLFIAIYNDQGWWSLAWLRIKKLYNQLPKGFRTLFVMAVMMPFEIRSAVSYTLRGNPMGYVQTWVNYGAGGGRGMKKWRDWVDWVGGLPFEVAKPEHILDKLRPDGFELVRMVTRLGGWGCNEFVFRRHAADRASS